MEITMEKMIVTQMTLCRPCYEAKKQECKNLDEGHRPVKALKLWKACKDNKIRCDACGKMRYGAIYKEYQYFGKANLRFLTEEG